MADKRNELVGEIGDIFDPAELERLAWSVHDIVFSMPDYWRLMYIDVVEFRNRHFAATFHQSAKKVEAVLGRRLLRHDAVKDAAVIGIADEKWGQVPIAFLVLQAGIQITAEALIMFLDKRLSKIKLPKRFVFVQALPRNVYGKVLKNELRAQFIQVPCATQDSSG
jgi:acyl-CoA synthetase (AMP-forming)/AMP-acid ligase II